MRPILLALLQLLLLSLVVLGYAREGEIDRGERSVHRKSRSSYLVSRSRRLYDSRLAHSGSASGQARPPCPSKCTCSYGTMNCNELIESCDECIYWSHIEFTQISQLKANSFSRFRFAPNRTTYITIYKLLNSTVTANAMANLVLPKNSLVQIKFQYNSLIQFAKDALNGLYLDSNSTLLFFFPYITQVVFANRCFDGVEMKDENSRLIVRVIKSFSVKFAGDFSKYFQGNQPRGSTGFLPDSFSADSSAWKISTGQFVIDIKSTHTVKFEERSFAHLQLGSNSKLYIDLELIEKLMIQRHAFSYTALHSNALFTFYSKQISFIDLRALSFANMTLFGGAKSQIYLEELTTSLCVQRHVFSNINFIDSSSSSNVDTYFNFSVINSKNVMFMHHSFSNLVFDNMNARLVVGVFNMPSALLLLHNNYYYQKFLGDRLAYSWLTKDAISGLDPVSDYYSHHNHHLQHPYSGPSFLPTDQYGPGGAVGIHSSLNGPVLPAVGVGPKGILNMNDKFDISTFYLHNKQTYSFNVSIERDCFSNLTFNNKRPSTGYSQNVWLVADNVHTFLLDNNLLTYPNSSQALNRNPASLHSANINFQLNVKNFVTSYNALQNFFSVGIEFLRDPRVFKFGLAPMKSVSSQKPVREVRLVGLNLLKATKNETRNGPESVSFDVDYYSDNVEPDNNDDFDSYLSLDSEYKQAGRSITFIDNLCQIVDLPRTDTIIKLESGNGLSAQRSRRSSASQPCTCQVVNLMYNQLSELRSLKELSQSRIRMPCKLSDLDVVNTCRKHLENKCGKREAEKAQFLREYGNKHNDESYFLKDFVKQWRYCISEIDPHLRNAGDGVLSSDNYAYNGINDMDNPFSMSVSSSFFENGANEDELLDGGYYRQPSLLSSNSNNNSSWSSSSLNNSTNNIGKIIGIIIVCFVCGIIVFMIAVNIIQYKFRNDLLDDLECSSVQTTNNNNTIGYNHSSSSSSGGGGSGHSRKGGSDPSGNGICKDGSPSSPRYNVMIDCNEVDLRVDKCHSRAKAQAKQRPDRQEDLNEISKYSDDNQDYQNDYDEEEASMESRDKYEYERDQYEENDEDGDARCLDDDEEYLSSSRIKDRVVVNKKEYYSYYDDYDESEERTRRPKQCLKSANKKTSKGCKKSICKNDEASISIDKMTSDSGKSSATNSSLAEADNQFNCEQDEDRTITPPPPYEVTSNYESKSASKKAPKAGDPKKELAKGRNVKSKQKGGNAGGMPRSGVLVNDEDTGYYSHN